MFEKKFSSNDEQRKSFRNHLFIILITNYIKLGIAQARFHHSLIRQVFLRAYAYASISETIDLDHEDKDAWHHSKNKINLQVSTHFGTKVANRPCLLATALITSRVKIRLSAAYVHAL